MRRRRKFMRMRRNNKVNLIIRGIIMLGMIVTLSGCGVTYPEISPESEKMVVEYAAGILLKYNLNNQHRLLRLAEPDPAEDPASGQAAGETPPDPMNGGTETQTQTPEGGEITVADNSAAATPEVTRSYSLSEVMAIDGLDFQYDGYELATEYPDEVTPDMVYFVVNAQENQQLLILNFSITNNSGADVNLDMFRRNCSFLIGVNGGGQEGSMLTMLLNDLSTFMGEIPAGQTVEVILIRDITAEEAGQIGSVELSIEEGGESYAVNL